MKVFKATLAFLLIIICMFFFWFFYLRNAKERKLMNEGYNVVNKVEEYRKRNRQLPDSLAQVGILENEETELYLNYTKTDSLRYRVWIGISFEESRFYYSDTRKWENYFRK